VAVPHDWQREPLSRLWRDNAPLRSVVTVRLVPRERSIVRTRLSLEEMAGLQVAAAADNRSVSSWVRQLLRRELGECRRTGRALRPSSQTPHE